MVKGIELSYQCNQYRESCLLKRKLQQLDDVGLLAINHIYVFTESLSSSVTRHFDCTEKNHAIIGSLGLFERLVMPSTKVYEWCAECISCSCKDLREVHSTTVIFLKEALESENELDLVVANVLHQTLTLLKSSDYIEQRGEDSFAHNVLSPLLDNLFSADVRLNHLWAKTRLNKTCKDFKSDYGVFANGSSKRYVGLVAEFKPKEGRQQPESDFIKVGKQMRIMLNELLEVGAKDPVVHGILVKDDQLLIFKMYLAESKTYIMTQLSSVHIGKNISDLAFIPSIVSRLNQLMGFIIVND